MIKHQAFKYMLDPHQEQLSMMTVISGACRYVFNKALEIAVKNHLAGEKYVPYNKTAPLLVQWKSQENLSWLKLAPSQSLQQSLKDLDRAFHGYISRKSGFPKFRKKGTDESFRFPQQRVKVDEGNKKVYLPKIGWVRYRKSRDIIGEIKNITISQSANKWYVSFQTQIEVPDPVHTSNSTIKVTLSDEGTIFLSDGKKYALPATYSKHFNQLNKLIRQKHRKIKNSQSWLAFHHSTILKKAKLRNILIDFLHKTSTLICNNHAKISVDTKKGNSARKTKPLPINFKPYEFLRQITYKQSWNGGSVCMEQS